MEDAPSFMSTLPASLSSVRFLERVGSLMLSVSRSTAESILATERNRPQILSRSDAWINSLKEPSDMPCCRVSALA